MNRFLRLICILLLAPASVADARMYQWLDPDTGTTQLSGRPPAWYRSGDAGPRVFVFEDGRVVDDTGIPLPEVQMERLRQEALLRAEEDRQQAMAKLLQAKRQKAALDLENRGEDAIENSQDANNRTLAPVESPGPASDTTGPTAEELRALIEQYELVRTQNARQLVEEAGPGLEDQPPSK